MVAITILCRYPEDGGVAGYDEASTFSARYSPEAVLEAVECGLLGGQPILLTDADGWVWSIIPETLAAILVWEASTRYRT